MSEENLIVDIDERELKKAVERTTSKCPYAKFIVKDSKSKYPNYTKLTYFAGETSKKNNTQIWPVVYIDKSRSSFVANGFELWINQREIKKALKETSKKIGICKAPLHARFNVDASKNKATYDDLVCSNMGGKSTGYRASKRCLNCRPDIIHKNWEEAEVKRLTTDWLKKDWKKEVIMHYTKMYNENWKNISLSAINHSLGIHIVGLIEKKGYRVYSLLTPWMFDTIIEFKIDLSSQQIKSLRKKWMTELEPLTNEKSRWIAGSTSLMDDYTKKTAIKIGISWAKSAFYDANRILSLDLHKNY